MFRKVTIREEFACMICKLLKKNAWANILAEQKNGVIFDLIEIPDFSFWSSLHA